MEKSQEKGVSPQTTSPTPSEHVGDTYEVVNDVETHGEMKRVLSKRMIHVISLGSQIGSGLFIATGKALRDGKSYFVPSRVPTNDHQADLEVWCLDTAW